ncbi:MAG: glycosyltransferase [Thermodesulfobacteriota bacterium]
MTKVSILTTAHSPYDDRIYHREAVSLVRAGYRVSIIAPWDRSHVTPEGIQILAVRMPKTRLGRFCEAAPGVFKTALSTRADVYHFHDPDLLPWMALLSAFGRRVIYDVHEYNGKSIATKSWLPSFLRKPIGLGVERLEAFASARFSGVITVSPHMSSLFSPFNRVVESIANYPLPWFVQSCACGADVDSERVIYVGGLNGKRGYGMMFDAMALVRARRPQAGCVILGPVDCSDVAGDYPRLQPRGEPVNGIVWHGSVDLSEIASNLLTARIGWIPWQWTPNNDQGTPVKLFEYMAAGRPVVASRLGFIARIVERVGCGLLVPPADAHAHAEAICHLLDRPALAAEMGTRGRHAVQDHYNWSAEESKLLSFYDRILSV